MNESTRRGLRVIAKVLSGIVATLFGLITLAILALWILIETSKSTVIDSTNAALHGTFRGRLEILDFEDISLFGVSGADARVSTAEGRVVLSVEDLGVTIRTFDLLWDLLSGSPTYDIQLEQVHARHVRVDLGQTSTGDLLLAEAFSPAQTNTTPATTSGPQVRVNIASIAIDHAWVHGPLKGPTPLDAGLRDVTGTLSLQEGALRIRRVEFDAKVRRFAMFSDLKCKANGSVVVSVDEEDSSHREASFVPPALLESSLDLVVTDRDSSLRAKLRQKGSVLDARAQGSLAPETLDPIVENVEGPIEIDARLHGDEPSYRTHFLLEHRGGRLTASLSLDDMERWELQGNVLIERLSPSWFAPRAPQISPLDAQFDFDLSRSAGEFEHEWRAWRGDIQGDISAFSVDDRTLPKLELNARLRNPEFRLEARTKTARDPSFVEVEGTLTDELSWPELDLAWQTDLELIESLLPNVRGSGKLRGKGHLDPRDRKLDFTLTSEVRNVRVPAVLEATAVSLRARVWGSWDDPSVRGRGALDEVVLLRGSEQERTFEQARVALSGRKSAARIELDLSADGQRLTLSGTLDAEGTLAARDLRLSILDAGETLVVRVARASFRAGNVSFESVRLEGAAEGQLDARYDGASLWVSGSVRNVALGPISHASRLGPQVTGTLDLDIDATFTFGTQQASGRLRALLTRGHVTQPGGPLGRVPPLDVELNLFADGKRIGFAARLENSLARPTPPRGTSDRSATPPPSEIANAQASTVSPLLVDLKGELVLPPTDQFAAPETWLRALVHVEGQMDIDLALIPAELLPPQATVKGRVLGSLRAERRDSARFPETHLTVETSSLELSYAADSTTLDSSGTGEASISTLKDYDVKLMARLDPRGRDRLEVDVSYKGRPLASSTLNFEAPLDDPSSETLIARLERSTFEWELDVPTRSFRNFPDQLRLSALEGSAAARLSVRGTLRDPQVEGRLDVQNLRGESQSHHEGLTGSFRFAVRDAKGHLEGKVTGPNSAALLVNTEVVLASDPREWIALPRSAQGRLRLERVPVSLSRAFVEQRVAGHVSGEATFRGLGTEQREASLKLDLSQLTVQGLALPHSTVEASLRDDRFETALRIKGDGFSAEARGQAPLTRSAPWSFSFAQTATGRLRAHHLPLELAQPLAGSRVVDLGGRLDLDMRAGFSEKGPWVEGRAELRDGRMQFPRLGQNIRHANLDLVWQRDGKIQLQDATFRGVTGKARLEGEAQMAGLFPEQARLRIRVDRNERLPVSFQGLGLGEFWGDVETEVSIDPDKKVARSKTQVHSLHLMFPQIPGSVQSLAEDPRITAGAWVNEDDFVELALQPLEKEKSPEKPWKIDASIDLGNELWLQQGPTRRVQVSGALNLRVAEEFRPEGKLRLSRGRIEINGRMFEVREGTISMQPNEPDNPIILAKAQWTSPDGITIVASFTGPAKSGTMTLSSEPPLPQDQVLSLLLFGDTEGLTGAGQGADGGEAGAQAAAVGGRLLTEGLNRVLSRIDAVDISTRLSGSGSDNVRPEVVVQLTNSLSLQVGYNLQEPSPGQAPDRTLISLEIRLVQGHAISGTIGDRGSSSLDWVWRHRY